MEDGSLGWMTVHSSPEGWKLWVPLFQSLTVNTPHGWSAVLLKKQSQPHWLPSPQLHWIICIPSHNLPWCSKHSFNWLVIILAVHVTSSLSKIQVFIFSQMGSFSSTACLYSEPQDWPRGATSSSPPSHHSSCPSCLEVSPLSTSGIWPFPLFPFLVRS